MNLSGVCNGGAKRTLSNGVFTLFSRWSLHSSHTHPPTHWRCTWNMHTRWNDMLEWGFGFSYCVAVNSEQLACITFQLKLTIWTPFLQFVLVLPDLFILLFYGLQAVHIVFIVIESYLPQRRVEWRKLLCYYAFSSVLHCTGNLGVSLAVLLSGSMMSCISELDDVRCVYLKFSTSQSLTALILWIYCCRIVTAAQEHHVLEYFFSSDLVLFVFRLLTKKSYALWL